MKKLIFIMTAVTLSLSMALAQEAGPKGKPGGPGGPGKHDGKGPGARMRGMEKMLEQLNLTDKQKAQVKEILKAERGNWEKGKDLTPEQRREKMMEQREELHKKIRAILTAEQKVKFDKILKEMKERMDKRGERPGKPGGKKGGAAGSGKP